MTATNAAETAILELIFKSTAWLSLAENDTTTPTTSLYVSLHTGDPGEAGTQATSECTYGSYARVAADRTAGGTAWTVTGNTADNTAALTFPEATSGSETATYVGIGDTISGAGNLLFYGLLTASLAITTGVEPEFAAGTLDVTMD